MNGVSFDTFYGNETTRIVTVGTKHNEGDTMRIAMTPQKSDIYVKSDADCLYYLDMDAFEAAISKLAETQFEITEYTERDLNGTINTKDSDQVILTTIPYDEGWNIYVDGEKIEYYKTLDALIAFDIESAGEHTLRIVYMPKCFVIGLSCTLACCLIFVLLCIFDLKRKRAKAKTVDIKCICNDDASTEVEYSPILLSDDDDAEDTLGSHAQNEAHEEQSEELNVENIEENEEGEESQE